MILAGIDEAGYGPLLGPLVVSAVAFDVPQPITDQIPDLAGMLAPAVAAKPPLPHGSLLVADSKVVHRLQNGLHHMEAASLIATELACGRAAPAQLEPLAKALGWAGQCRLPWYQWGNAVTPLWTSADAIRITRSMLQGQMASRGVRMPMARSALIDEASFNDQVGKTRNKAAVLSSHGMQLLKQIADHHAGDSWVVVDKNGARDRYLDLLLRTFPEVVWRVCTESPFISRYEWHRPDGLFRVDFQQRAEQACMATAWASMICKYLRERAMDQFNRWWMAESGAHIRPTAGYHTDALRWLSEMAPYLERYGPPQELWVRMR
jgi:ribonuclease HII